MTVYEKQRAEIATLKALIQCIDEYCHVDIDAYCNSEVLALWNEVVKS